MNLEDKSSLLTFINKGGELEMPQGVLSRLHKDGWTVPDDTKALAAMWEAVRHDGADAIAAGALWALGVRPPAQT